MKNKTFKTIVILTIISISAKIFGLLRDVILADCYGASKISDAYLIAIAVPTFLFYFVGHSLSASFIPMYTKIASLKGEVEAKKYSDKIMTASLLISTFFVVIVLIFPTFIIKLFANGFDSEQINIAKDIVQLSSITIYFMVIVNIFSSRLQICDHYYAPSLISFPRNFFLIFSVFISTYWGLWWLGFGVVLAYLGEIIILIPSIIKSKIKFSLNFSLKDEDVKETLKIMFPIFISVSVSQVNKIIDRSFASILAIGGISSLYYASIVNNSIQEILVTSVVVIVFTNVSKLVAANHYDEVDIIFQKSVKLLRFFLIPAMIGLIILSETVIIVMYGRGEFNSEAVKLTSLCLIGYSIGLCFMASREVLVKIFYSYKKTKITLISSLVGIILNIIFNLILSKFLGVFGLAISTSISAILQYLFLLVYYYKKIWKFNLFNYLKSFLKPIIGSIIMGISIYFLDLLIAKNISISIYMRFLIDVITGITIYFIVEFLLKSEELIFIKNILLSKKNKKLV